MDEIEQQYRIRAQERLARNLSHAAAGVVFEDIERAYIDDGVHIGAGTYIGPDVTIRGNSEIGKGCRIETGTRIENCRIGDEARVDHSVMTDSSVEARSTIGPFAYLRPDSRIGADVKIGDFVEVKNSSVGDGTKVSHLTYIGDADIGRDINIGCGVVFVNYDGKEKHRSAVGDGSFIGCNVNIISPVTIEAGAYIAAGTTVTGDVPSGSLAVSREKLRVVDGWVERRGLLEERLAKHAEAETETDGSAD